MRNDLRCFPLMLVLLFLLGVLSCNAEAEPPAKEESDKKTTAGPEPWEFDESLYTNSPKTGDRVWQYHKPKNAYRDPNSWFDSPHMGFPFNGDWTLEPNDVFPYPYSPGPNAEHPSYSPDPFWQEGEEE